MQSSKGMCNFIRVIQLRNIIQGRIYKNGLNTYLGCSNIPIIWKKHHLKLVHDEGYKHNQHCCERYFHDFKSCNGYSRRSMCFSSLYMTIKYIIENNCRFYGVTFKKNGIVKVQKFEDISNDETTIYCVKLMRPFSGKSQACNMNTFSGALNKSVFDGTTFFT